MRLRSSGFTLIELMIVVAVIAILAAIAFPAFNEQVRKSRRSEAASSMGQIQLALERWRADRPSYANSNPAAANYPNADAFDSTHYDFSLSGQSGTTYTLTAAPRGAQSGDRCGNLTSGPTSKPKWATASCN